jgi:hypothetical protein
MSSLLSKHAAVAALASAVAYSAAAAPAPTIEVPEEALSEIRRARIELYCGHDRAMQSQVRAAREHLRDSGCRGAEAAVVILANAAWLARRGRFQAAGEALNRALAQLTA